MAEEDMIIDCFPFFNELDILEIRLNELKDIVDVFVLTESPKTFTGKDKPLFFSDNKERFRDFNILHSVYDDPSECHPMERERRQKQFNLDYAYDHAFTRGDIIMFSDVDEIPRASLISDLAGQEWKSVGLMLTTYYYYLNCRGNVESRWPSIVLTRPEKRLVYDATRKNRVEKIVHNAGYHFSYFGDIVYKLESWGHADQFNKAPFNDPKHIEKCKSSGEDFLMRKGRRKIEFEFDNDLSYLPSHVLNNLERYGQWIKQSSI